MEIFIFLFPIYIIPNVISTSSSDSFLFVSCFDLQSLKLHVLRLNENIDELKHLLVSCPGFLYFCFFLFFQNSMPAVPIQSEANYAMFF